MEENKILTLGSLIGAEGGACMVSGYRLIDDERYIGVGYICVPYPMGFIEEESFMLIRARDVTKVYFEGFDDAAAQALAESLGELVNAKEDASNLAHYHQYLSELLEYNPEEE
ncbi:MAG: DUF4176 domain-containing protein [Atopobiaceae bacterium]|nr:DUF4176 domain-containing protein [Atopobiaceae bacterium]